MPVKTPLLSICIATYNRASFIGETLNSIIPQLDDDVELLVVDGASTDNTEDVVLKFSQKESRIRYIRLSAKGGVDQDYDKSIKLASGKYCWLFTDDDVLKPGAVAAVKVALKKDYDLIVVNAEVRNRELSVMLVRRQLVMQDNKEYDSISMENLFDDALHYLSFIGAVVIRRDLWLSRVREPYFGSEFIHVGVIFQNPLLETALIIAEPYISIRFGNAQWTPRSFDIEMFKWPKMVWSFTDISDEAKRRVTPREPWLNLRTLILQRSLGYYNMQSYRQYFSATRVNVLWKICSWLIACFPRKLIVGYHYLYSRIKSPEARASFDNHFAKPRR
jgi:glycosyltransferase involved in cell wall biosynthesis